MSDEKPQSPLRPLGYARPGVHRTRPVLAAIAIASSVAVGIFALFVLGFAVYGLTIIFIIRPKDTGDTISGDLPPMLIILPLGGIGAYASVRWLKSAVGMLRSK